MIIMEYKFVSGSEEAVQEELNELHSKYNMNIKHMCTSGEYVVVLVLLYNKIDE